MMDANRLLDAGSERERALLRAGISEMPSTESVRTAARVLGLVPRVALVAYLFGVVAKSIKWSSIGAYVLAPVAVVTGGVAVVYAVAERQAPMVAAVAPPVRIEAALDRPPALLASDRMPSAALQADGEKPPVSRAAVAARSDAATAHDASVDVRRQIEWIDHARSLAESGDATGALQSVDQYDRAYPHGVLSEEAALLRIEALAARGDRAAAATFAKRFLSEHPRSVHAAKVRALAPGAD
jgi:hypothetical protein